MCSTLFQQATLASPLAPGKAPIQIMAAGGEGKAAFLRRLQVFIIFFFLRTDIPPVSPGD